jgi:hypothetical protein
MKFLVAALLLFLPTLPSYGLATNISEKEAKALSVPQGCKRIVQKMPVSFPPKKAFFYDGETWNAKPYFESLGFTFPKGGYAFMFKSSSVLVLCTTPSEINLFFKLSDP